jgi:predicted Zn finger-like uncharacterized protein
MYSQCPECLARFRVGAGDLRAAGGTVRCGRCGSAFNALTWLSDTLPPPLGRVTAGRPPVELDDHLEQHGPVSGVEFHFTSSDIESVFVDPSDWPDRRRTTRREQAGGELHDFAAGPPIIVDTESRPFEDITLEGEGIRIEDILGIDGNKYDVAEDSSPTDEFQILGEVPDSAYPEVDEQDAPARGHDRLAEPDDDFQIGPDEVYAAEPVHFSATEHGESFSTARLRIGDESAPEIALARAGRIPAWVAGETSRETTEDDAVGIDVVAADKDAQLTRRRVHTDRVPDSDTSLTAVLERKLSPARPRRWSIAWSIGGLLLALMLLAQVTHYFRQDLVRQPQIGPVLKDIYSLVGQPLTPNWNLGAFELRQWGNGGAPDANGHLAVRASLTNRAAFAQPHPILRLELDNRFGDAIAVRDFEPAEYLKDASEASRMLGPGASAEAELLLADPGRDAVGYQLDVCLRESAAILRCARETN